MAEDERQAGPRFRQGPEDNLHDHEVRLRLLEADGRDRDLEMANVRHDLTDVKGTVTQLRHDLLGDPARMDDAGRGAIALIQRTVIQSEKRTSERLTSQTTELKRDLNESATEVRRRLDEREQGSVRLRDRTWNVLTIGLASTLAFVSYLVIHFLPAVPAVKP